MEKLLSARQMRDADQAVIESGVSSEVLMERAGTAIADYLSLHYQGKQIAFFCGSGNNGGDGYVAARLLSRRGETVAVCPVKAPKSIDCVRAAAQFDGTRIAITQSADYDVLVDCLLGTGANGRLSEDLADAVRRMNGAGKTVVACDVPTGLNADNGQAGEDTVCADVTLCIGAYKTGLFLSDGLDCAGKVALLEIGIDSIAREAELVDGEFASACFLKRMRNSHKGTYGRTALICGSSAYSGAAVLAVNGLSALRAGVGICELIVPQTVFMGIMGKVPECVLTAGVEKDVIALSAEQFKSLKNARSVAFGMGAGREQSVAKTLEKLLDNYEGNLLIDADGLYALSALGLHKLKTAKCRIALTPHLGEFARLLGEDVGVVATNPVGIAKEFAKKYGVTVALKSASTIITDGNRTLLSATGCSVLAKGGSGDTLAGFAAGIGARESDWLTALGSASYLFGVAAERVSEKLGEYAPVISEIAVELATVVALAEKGQV